ncbi:nucleotidyltransferase domain-containing protein [uncultured Desulfuromonas sp.]|uniref:type VII toxin-antitoxin system MntA family adenylyltransferase antitoxin n=1 Tax=uncultured Desulfuromonas sp. TaxID=181013 RepID=UPI002AAA6EF1|nr:nucleotidyltransferase domain-containing protein [uncultured Desulfuromonas sp.]
MAQQLDSMEIFKQTVSALNKEQGLKLAILYGSAATGTMRANSDVDLAVLYGHALDAEQKMRLKDELERTFMRSVDLVDLSNLSGTILKQILCKGKVVIKNDSPALAMLLQRMIYNQADMMPYVTRTLMERQQRFLNG